MMLALAVLAGCGREIDSQPAPGAAAEMRDPGRSGVRTEAAGAAGEGSDSARAGNRDGRAAVDGSVRRSDLRDGPTASAAGGGATASIGSPAGEANAAPRYRTHLYSERDADVHALLEETESSSGAAFVEQLHADLGDRVVAGRLLATLEDDRLELDVRAATARAEEMRARLERMRKLTDQGYAAAAEFETLEHSVEEAEAELEQARLDLSRTRVRAPFGGVVARRYVRVGERVESATPLFRVTAMAPLRARILVPEAQSAAFRRGTAVRVTGVDGVEAEGRVVRLGPTVDPASGTREVVVELARVGALLPGGEVVVQVAATPDASEALPNAAPGAAGRAGTPAPEADS